MKKTRQALLSILLHTMSASDNLFSENFFSIKILPCLPCSQEFPIQRLKTNKREKS